MYKNINGYLHVYIYEMWELFLLTDDLLSSILLY